MMSEYVDEQAVAQERGVMAGHVQYEWDMLNQTAALLLDIKDRGHAIQGKAEGLPVGLRSAIIESFAVHARTLIEFLFFRPNDKDIRLGHYDPSWESSKDRDEGFDAWKHCHDRASREISHLSLGRWRENKAGSDAFLWDVADLRDRLNKEMERAIGIVPGLHRPEHPPIPDWEKITATYSEEFSAGPSSTTNKSAFFPSALTAKTS